MSTYQEKHKRVHKSKGNAKLQVCVGCGNGAQEWAQISGTDGEGPNHYQAMCCSCHQKYDNHWNEITRNKVAKSSSDRWKDPKYKERVGKAISRAKMGHYVSEETRRKISESNKGNHYATGGRTQEQRDRIRIARWGR